MARTIDDIYNQISGEASSYPILNELEANSSNMSFWHYIKRVFAFGAHQLEVKHDQLVAEIDEKLKVDYNLGTAEWYKSLCYEFQYGDQLKLASNPHKIYYDPIDTSKQIIKRASVITLSGGGIRIRVQKLSGTEVVQMSSVELGAFTFYINRRKIAGTLITTESNTPDTVTINANVVINREVFSSTGVRHSDGSYAVLNGLRRYVNEVPFDEVIYISSLGDYINDIPGVIGFHPTAFTINGSGVSLSSGKIVLPNGYGKILENDNTFNVRMTYELI